MAKAKKIEKTDTPAKNRKRRRARRVNPAPRSNPSANPPVLHDLTHVVLPALGAYGATRVIQRVVYSFVQRRWPKLGKYAHAIAGVAGFGAVWLTAHRIKALAQFHDGILIGSGVAAGQGIATAILPAKYSWLLNDCRPEDVQPIAPKQPLITQVKTPSPSGVYDEFTELESIAERQMNRGTSATPGQIRQIQQQQAVADDDDDDADVSDDPGLAGVLDDDEDVDDLFGDFGGGN